MRGASMLALVALGALVACAPDDGASHGTATITIDYGGGNVRQLTKEVTVRVGEPVRIGSTTETNPMNLVVGSEAQSPAAEGDFSLYSALEIQPDLGPTPVLLQFWTLSRDGASVSGNLTDPHTAEASTYNMVWATDTIGGDPYTTNTFPYMMATGSTLSGTVDGGDVRLTIQGAANAAGGLSSCGFRIEVDASR